MDNSAEHIPRTAFPHTGSACGGMRTDPLVRQRHNDPIARYLQSPRIDAATARIFINSKFIRL